MYEFTGFLPHKLNEPKLANKCWISRIKQIKNDNNLEKKCLRSYNERKNYIFFFQNKVEVWIILTKSTDFMWWTMNWRFKPFIVVLQNHKFFFHHKTAFHRKNEILLCKQLWIFVDLKIFIVYEPCINSQPNQVEKKFQSAQKLLFYFQFFNNKNQNGVDSVV